MLIFGTLLSLTLSTSFFFYLPASAYPSLQPLLQLPTPFLIMLPFFSSFEPIFPYMRLSTYSDLSSPLTTIWTWPCDYRKGSPTLSPTTQNVFILLRQIFDCWVVKLTSKIKQSRWEVCFHKESDFSGPLLFLAHYQSMQKSLEIIKALFLYD